MKSDTPPCDPSFWRGRRVFITGHTGFKGSWLTLWLQTMGAEVHGYALPPRGPAALFHLAHVAQGMAGHTLADILDREHLAEALKKASPEVVFHLAAQALVRESYRRPVETYAVNIMGTVHLLEALRTLPDVRAVVNVTTDKCYADQEWPWPYRETDTLGGHDPYASSKACSELVSQAYRQAFLKERKVGLATARAGNVIGGGDYSQDRLLPDFFRALDLEQAMVVRSPHAIRPWQHVLEPLAGYLKLAEKLYGAGQDFAQSWNFGPAEQDARTVGDILAELQGLCPSFQWLCTDEQQPHESHWLRLDSTKARAYLNWKPRWTLAQALRATVEWHQAWQRQEDMRAFTLGQITNYSSHPVPHA